MTNDKDSAVLAERVERVTKWLDGGCSTWGTPMQDIREILNALRQPTQSDVLEAMERNRILQLFRGYADFLDAGADALSDLQAMANIGGATHIRQLCEAIERNGHKKEK